MIKKPILGTLISTGTSGEFISSILQLAVRRESSYVCVANVHMLMESYKNPAFSEVVNKADITTPDGMPLVKYIRRKYTIAQERIAGMDLMPALMKESEKKNLSVFFFGSTEETLDKILENSKKRFPELTIAGRLSPPFAAMDEYNMDRLIQQINAAKPNLVFVALGCPKQEMWMHACKQKVQACMVGLGAAFPVFAGVQKRAPEWMQAASLEWLFRLGQEPGRLFKRYFMTNSLFILLIFREHFHDLFKGKARSKTVG